MGTVTATNDSGCPPGQSGRARHEHYLLLVGRTLLPAVMVGLLVEIGAAQQRPRLVPPDVRILTSRNPLPAVNPYAAIIQPSEEATTLLRRATEGIERQDWKLVIDSLQRIVELPGEHVLTSDGQLYESARRHAHRRIAALPRPGLEAYRLVHDGEAAALLKRGVDAHRAELLSVVVDRFLCTSVGDRAAFTLADWLMDEGRFSEAAGLLQSTFGASGQGGIYPDSALPGWAVPARLAVCAAALGQRQRAEALVKVAATQPGAASMPSSGGSEKQGQGAPRLAALRSHLAAQQLSLSAEPSKTWPCLMGNWARDGQHSEVVAAFEHETWQEPLVLGSELRADVVSDYARRYQLMPVRHVVTDGKVLVVRREQDLLALDIDSFSKRWESRKRHEEAIAVSAAEQFRPAQPQNVRGDDGKSSTDAQMRSNPVVIRMLHDSVGGAVSLVPASEGRADPGMALTVEWLGDPPQPIRENMARRPAGFPGRDPFTMTHPNRIIAYSLRDGSFLWKSDASSTRQINMAGSGPAETEFLAAPILADGNLVAPCRMNSDLFAVVLDPKTGRLVRQLYLCGTGGGAFDSLAALDPCLADGAVFFPTGRELLVAVETSDWSVRWALRYASAKEGQAARGWLPGPPVAVSDVVLLAPTDADELFCFDRASGALRWKSDRGTYTHIISASDKGVWVGGQDVAMLDLETGRTIWQENTADMSGRGCLSGDRLYVPTFEGLRALHADGSKIDLKLPVVTPVLGNLLAWEGSLYSVGAFTLKKYPDLEKGYEQAVARHRENPSDPSRALRLASLEELRNEPARAIEVLSRIAPDLKETNPPQYESVVRLRVRSMLKSVELGKVQGEDALKLLREAREIAISPADALASIDELGKFLTRNKQPFEAALQYLTLVVSPEGDLEVSADGDQIVEARADDGVMRLARAVAVDRILDAFPDLSAEQVRQYGQRLEGFLTDAVRKRDASVLLWLAESPGLGEVAHRASVLLGSWAAMELRYEQAESYFLRVLMASKDSVTLAEAATRLAALYLEPDELHQPVSAAVWLDRLRKEWSDVQVPRSALERPGDISTQPAGQARPPLPGREAADELSSRIDRQILKKHQLAMAPVPLGPPGAPSLRLHKMARSLSFRGDRAETLADQLMLFVEGNKVESHAVDDGGFRWDAELRLLGDLAVEAKQLDVAVNAASQRTDALGRARGLLTGQTMIVNTEYGIHALGLLTGRRLWSRSFEPPESPGDDAASDACIWTHDGYVVAVDGRRNLEVAYVTQGERTVWRASMETRKWAAVRARGPYVVAVNGSLEVADVFHLADGRRIGECKFHQDVSPNRQVNVTLFDDVICGPASLNEVKALQLAAPGVEAWRVEMPTAISQIFKPTPNLLAVADRTGLVKLIDPSSGKQILEIRIKSCGQGVIDGAIMDGVLYVYGYQVRATEPAELDKQQFGLAAINMARGEILWELRDLPGKTYLSEDLLRASPNAIPLVSFSPAGIRAQQPNARADGVGASAGAVELEVIDKKTGKHIGEKITTPMDSDTGASKIQTVEVWPGRILVVSGSSYLRYPVTVGGGGRAEGQGRSVGGEGAGPAVTGRRRAPAAASLVSAVDRAAVEAMTAHDRAKFERFLTEIHADGLVVDMGFSWIECAQAQERRGTQHADLGQRGRGGLR